jgi:hypothetical protein
MRAKKKGLPENEEHTSCAGAITDALDLSIHPSGKKEKEKKFPTEHRDDFSLRGGGGGGAHSNSAPLMERVSMMMMFK